jgi:hypothetical protein
MARKVGVTTLDARRVLSWMVEHQYIAATGNGAWIRYCQR